MGFTYVADNMNYVVGFVTLLDCTEIREGNRCEYIYEIFTRHEEVVEVFGMLQSQELIWELG